MNHSDMIKFGDLVYIQMTNSFSAITTLCGQSQPFAHVCVPPCLPPCTPSPGAQGVRQPGIQNYLVPLQATVNSLQFAGYSLLAAGYSLHSTAYNLQHIVYSLPSTAKVESIDCSLPSVVFTVDCAVCLAGQFVEAPSPCI